MKNQNLKKYFAPTLKTVCVAQDVVTASFVSDDGFDRDIFGAI